MKLIFLDVDGVLNSHESYERLIGSGKGGILGVDPIYLERFNRIIKETKAKIVLSSTWRKGDWRKELAEGGFDIDLIIDVTPIMPLPGGAESMERGKEIAQWLHYTRKNITKYAILDDDSDFLPEQPLFKTTWKKGLTEEVTQAVIDYLNAQ